MSDKYRWKFVCVWVFAREYVDCTKEYPKEKKYTKVFR